jgi:hypothetical protein
VDGWVRGREEERGNKRKTKWETERESEKEIASEKTRSSDLVWHLP